jgi:hypothetical protein
LMKRKKLRSNWDESGTAWDRGWKTGFSSDIKASDNGQPRDPNCMQSDNIAGQLPNNGSLNCAKLLPAADVRNVL